MEKCALVTGGSRGIGLGIVTSLLEAGFNVALNGVRDQAAVEDLLNDLKKYGPRVEYIRGDIGSKTDREYIVREVLSRLGKINVLVNNAGIAPRERCDILHASEESFEDLMRTNLQGPYFLTQKLAAEMIRLRGEHPEEFCTIINVSSISAEVASVNRGEYCISKAGVAMATKLWAARLGEYDIPVYEVQPGIIATDMTSVAKEKYDTLFADGLAVQRRWGYPSDVAAVVCAMARGCMPYSSGQMVRVDGGVTLQRL